MLKSLKITNFILIEELIVGFDNGFNVLTGETGAGKSILIGAISLVLGGKSSKSYIRKGSSKSIIEAEFILKKELIDILKDEYNIEFIDDRLIIKRELLDSGRNNININGVSYNITKLKSISELLVDIHGQHEHQSLLYPKKHLEMLDLYGSENLKTVKDKVCEYYQEIKSRADRLKSLVIDDQEIERKLDIFNYQVQEIDDVELKENEDEELETKFLRLKNSELINSTLSESIDGIDGDNRFNIKSELNTIINSMNGIEDFDPEYKKVNERLNSLYYEIDDIKDLLQEFKDGFYYDSKEAYEVEKRLDQINNLKKKFGNSYDEIIKYRDYLSSEIETLENNSVLVEKLNTEMEIFKAKYIVEAQKLSSLRKKIAVSFSNEMMSELKLLNLKDAEFVVEINDLINDDNEYAVTKDGFDSVEYLISLNKGEIIKPLKSVASGGELSRIMLALKVIFARADNIPLMIFDEIDTGISGKTASIVADKIYEVAKYHQILCISHLSQIAFMADSHYLIEKSSNNIKTNTVVYKLEEEDRINELARLIGGNDITSNTIETVKELLDISNEKKK